MTLLVFLSNNNKWLKISQKNLYNFAVGIAKSRPTSKEKVLQNIYNTIERYLIDFTEI